MGQGTISSLQAHQLEQFAADIWMLSPPCQPYTRRGARRDAEDPRASSFLHLISLIPGMKVILRLRLQWPCVIGLVGGYFPEVEKELGKRIRDVRLLSSIVWNTQSKPRVFWGTVLFRLPPAPGFLPYIPIVQTCATCRPGWAEDVSGVFVD